jgi:molybdopterin synthase sulfur carrier subunit
MLVSVKLFTSLADYVPGIKSGEAFSVEIDDGATLFELTTRLRLPQEEVKLLFVNGLAKSPDYRLQNDDEVGIFPPIGGG